MIIIIVIFAILAILSFIIYIIECLDDEKYKDLEEFFVSVFILCSVSFPCLFGLMRHISSPEVVSDLRSDAIEMKEYIESRDITLQNIDSVQYGVSVINGYNRTIHKIKKRNKSILYGSFYHDEINMFEEISINK